MHTKVMHVNTTISLDIVNFIIKLVIIDCQILVTLFLNISTCQGDSKAVDHVAPMFTKISRFSGSQNNNKNIVYALK